MIKMNSSVNGYSQYHESRIEGDCVGNLTRGCIISRLKVMRSQEQSTYSYRSYEPPMFPPDPSSRYNVDESIPHLNSSWREKICHWSFSVVDHFDLSRDVVAVSMSLFDRFLATRGNRCDGSTALLTSLTTLHITVKVNEVRRIKLGTLAKLSRGQFGPRDIEEMEWNVLTSLEWKIHPPTSMSFVSHLLLLLPPQIDDACKEEIYSLSRYVTELSVCDSAFVEVNPSSVAFAAILISLEDPNHRKFISSSVRDEFMRSVERHAELYQDDEQVSMARPKLTKLLKDSFAQDAPSQCDISLQTQNHPQQQHSVALSASVTGSITGMQIQDQDTKTDDSSITSRLSQLSGLSCYSMSISLDSNMSANQRVRVSPVSSGSNANTMLTRLKNHDLIVQDLLPPPAIVAFHPQSCLHLRVISVSDCTEYLVRFLHSHSRRGRSSPPPHLCIA